jgi:hypothetical protein
MKSIPALIDELGNEARKKVPVVWCESLKAISNEARPYAKGFARWSKDFERYDRIEIRYTGDIYGLACLAHEVGHVNTLLCNEHYREYNLGGLSQCKYERLASRWGLAWLRPRLSQVDFEKCVGILNGWLASYYDDSDIEYGDRDYFKINKLEEVIA